jgi:hypothetical protein
MYELILVFSRFPSIVVVLMLNKKEKKFNNFETVLLFSLINVLN